MVELGKPFYELMSKWQRSDVFRSAYDTMHSNIFQLFTSIVNDYIETPTEQTEQPLLRCAKFIKCLVQCGRSARGGVKFGTEKDAQSDPANDGNNMLHAELADLFITLIAPLDQIDANISKMHLILVIEVMRGQVKLWKELLFTKISTKLCALDESLPSSERNEILMQKWLLPKLARTLNLKTSPTEQLCVTPPTEDTTVEEPTTHNFRLDRKTDEDVLASISSILLYVANDSAKSCANILNIVPDQPAALLPILTFITNQIKESKDEECTKILISYYTRLVNYKSHPDYHRCIALLLKSSPIVLQNQICTDIGQQLNSIDDFTEFVILVNLRMQLPDTSVELTLNDIGRSWARLIIQTDGWIIDDRTDDLLQLICTQLPNTFNIVFDSLVKQLLTAFQQCISTDSFAALLDLFGRFRSAFTTDDVSQLQFLTDVFDELIDSQFDTATVMRGLHSLLIVAGKCFCFEEIDEYSFSTNWFFTALLIDKICSVLLIVKSVKIESAVNLNRKLLSFACGQFAYTKEAWEHVQLSSIESRQNLGYLVFENFIQEADTGVCSTSNLILSNKEFQSEQPNETMFQLITSEILNESNITSNCYQLAQSTDSSLLIGAIAQIMEVGISTFSKADRVNFCPLISTVLTHAPSELNEPQWDFIICNVTDWLDSVNQSITDGGGNIHDWALLAGTVRVLNNIIRFLNSPGALVDPSLPPNLLDTWKEFFLPEITQRLFRIYLFLSDVDFAGQTLIQFEIFNAMEPALARIGLDELLTFDIPLKLSIELSADLPDNINSLCNHLYTRLSNENMSISLASYHFLRLLLPKIIVLYKESSGGTEPPTVILENTMKILSQESEAGLVDTRTSVLAISLCLHLIPISGSANFLHFFLGSEHFSSFLDRVWNELPQLELDALSLPSLDEPLPIGSDMYQLQKWALAGVNEVAQICPGSVRLWQKSLTNKQMQRDVQSYFSQYLSAKLVLKELKDVKTIQALSCVPYLKSRSMMATYTVDDLEVEIMITLPTDWPLSRPKIEGNLIF